MDSLRRVSSRKVVFDDALPRSSIITTAADVDDISTHRHLQQQQQQQQPAAERYVVNAVSYLTNGGRLSVGSGPGADTAAQDQPDLHHSATEQQHVLLQQQGAGSTSSSVAAAAAAAQRDAAVSDNPLDVMLTIRAGRIGDSADAMRQQLLMMKLASGRNNFDTQLNASMQLPDVTLDTPGSDAVAGMRVASVTFASPARRGSVAGQGRAAKLAASQRAASLPVKAQLEAAADAATAAVAVASAPGGTSVPLAAAPLGAAGNDAISSSLTDAAGSTHSQASGTGVAAAGCGQPPQPQRSISLAGMRNNSMHRSLIMRQPSLQRLLSSSSRNRLPSGAPDEQSAPSDVRSRPGTAAAVGAAGDSSSSGVVSAAADRFSSGQLNLLPQAPGSAPNGDLPMIQQPPASQVQLSSARTRQGCWAALTGLVRRG
ncbi:hypothetical protein COO60DRAFT_1627493 [Scenedesmus sp. NREL 46B-D3]|nr:hypothetical protein COO60DRAFT_1627493 [Scenedesmus sp. NREL 46B-D3]